MTTKYPSLGGSSIRQVVLARNVAQKFKSISSNLVLQKRRNADKGDFQVTHVDEPQEPSSTKPFFTETPSHRQSTANYSGLSFLKQPPNNYRTEPIDRFQTDKVERIIEEAFRNELKGLVYDPSVCAQKTKILCDKIKEQVKSLNFSRYKYIVIVFIGLKSGQTTRVASQCVWDIKFDNYAQYVFDECSEIFALGTVYGVYNE